tara:strand:+ start:3451 stop:3645 length:195 start_codon:yes stop_codon:yes gene_type:complete
MKKVVIHKYRSERVAKFFAEHKNRTYLGWRTNFGNSEISRPMDKRYNLEALDGGAYCVSENIEE